MNNSEPTRSQLNTSCSNVTSTPATLDSHISYITQGYPRPSGSSLTKRKATESLTSHSLKNRRNLSRNGFQHAEVHELSSDDEINSKLQRTRYLANKVSQKGAFSHRALPGSLPAEIPCNRPDNQGTLTAKPKSTQKLSCPLIKHSYDKNEVRSWRTSEAKQQATNKGGKLVSSTDDRSLSSLPLGSDSQGNQGSSLDQRTCSADHYVEYTKMQPRNLEAAVHGSIFSHGSLVHKGGNSKLAPNSWSTSQIETSLESLKQTIANKKVEIPPKSQHNLMKVGRSQDSATRGAVSQNPHEDSHQNLIQNINMSESQRRIQKHDFQITQSVLNRPRQNTNAIVSGHLHQEEDSHGAVSGTILKDSTLPLPDLPSCMQLSSTTNIFAKQKEKQRLKYGIGCENEISKRHTPLAQFQNHNELGLVKEISSPRSHERNDIPISLSPRSLKPLYSSNIDRLKGLARVNGSTDPKVPEQKLIRSEVNILKQATGVRHPSPGRPSYAETVALDSNQRLTCAKSTPPIKEFARHQSNMQNLKTPLDGDIPRPMTNTLVSSIKDGFISSKNLNAVDNGMNRPTMTSQFGQASHPPGYRPDGQVTNKKPPPQKQTELDVREGFNDNEVMKQNDSILETKNWRNEAVRVNDTQDGFISTSDRRSCFSTPAPTKVIQKDSTEPLQNSSQFLRNRKDLSSGRDAHREIYDVAQSQPANEIGRIEISEAGRLIDESLARSKAKKDSSRKTINQGPDNPKTGSKHNVSAIDIEKVTDDDWLLIQLRRDGWELKDIHSRWKEWTGSTKARDTLRKRLVRLRKTFPDIIPGENENPNETRKHNLSILRQIRDGDGNENGVLTGDNGLSHDESTQSKKDRAKKRSLALSHRPPKNISPPRNKSGGKQLSRDLQNYIIDSLQRGNEDLSEADDEDNEAFLTREISPEAEDDYIHFAYQVRRRTVLPGQYEVDCPWHVCSDPFSSIAEANEAAVAEAKITREIEVWPLTKWNMEISEETGLIYLRGTGINGAVEVEVQQFLRNYYDAVTPKSKASWLSRRVFDVYEIRTTSEKTIEWGHDIIEETEKDPQAHFKTFSSYQTKARTVAIANETENCTGNMIASDQVGRIARIETEESKTDAQEVDEDEHLFTEAAEINPQPSDQLCGAKESKVIVRTIIKPKIITNTIHVMERPVGSISAIRDKANRLAGKTFRQRQKEVESDPSRKRPTMDNYFAQQQADEEMNSRLDNMEMDDENFDDVVRNESIQHEDGQSARHDQEYNTEIRVRVVERTLENPRNF